MRFVMAVVCVCFLAGSANGQFTDIGDIQEYLPDGTANSPYAGQTVTIAGHIVEVDASFSSCHIVDSTGGVYLWAGYLVPNPQFQVGEYVEITGSVNNDNICAVSIHIISYANRSIGTPPSPVAIAIEDAVGSEYKSGLVSVTGRVGLGGTSSFFLVGSTRSLEVRIDPDVARMIIPGDTYMISGALWADCTQNKLITRDSQDVVSVEDPLPTDVASWGAVKSLYR